MRFAKRFSPLALLLPLILTAGLAGAWPWLRPDRSPESFAAARRPLRVTFLDVGQGDACVIEAPSGRVVVVDGGGHPGTDERDGGDPGARVVVPFLRSRGISVVDWIVPTHPDDDHVQGLIAVADRLAVRGALDGGAPGRSACYARLRALLARRRIPVVRVQRGQIVDLGGGARLEVLNPPAYPIGAGASASNERSLVLRLVYGRARLLLTGDAGARAEEDLLASGQNVAADFLKVGHHGARTSSVERFLERVAPQIAVISCGRNNLFGHPAPDVLRRLERRGIRVFRTDQQGALTVESDGRRLRVVPTLAHP